MAEYNLKKQEIEIKKENMYVSIKFDNIENRAEEYAFMDDGAKKWRKKARTMNFN